MNKRNIINIVQPLISQGKLKKALNLLSEYVKGKDKYLENSLLMQTASFNRNSRDWNNGLISKENYDIAMARLNYSLTQIMEDLPTKGNVVDYNNNREEEHVDENTNNLAKQSKTKILFLSANPRDTGNLRLGEELRNIKDILVAATLRDNFELISEPAVQITTILKAMQVHKPEIVHFSGHGVGDEGIVVEDIIGNTVKFSTSGLNRLFKRFHESVKCVVLNACYSADQAEVISNHDIYVIGMNKAVADNAGIDFAAGFYQSLGEGSDIEFAYDMAMVANSANLDDVDTPELWFNGEKLDL